MTYVKFNIKFLLCKLEIADTREENFNDQSITNVTDCWTERTWKEGEKSRMSDLWFRSRQLDERPETAAFSSQSRDRHDD